MSRYCSLEKWAVIALCLCAGEREWTPNPGYCVGPYKSRPTRITSPGDSPTGISLILLDDMTTKFKDLPHLVAESVSFFFRCFGSPLFGVNFPRDCFTLRCKLRCLYRDLVVHDWRYAIRVFNISQVTQVVWTFQHLSAYCTYYYAHVYCWGYFVIITKCYIYLWNRIKHRLNSNRTHRIRIHTIRIIFHPLEVVTSYRDPQLQVGENYVLTHITSVDLHDVLSWGMSEYCFTSLSAPSWQYRERRKPEAVKLRSFLWLSFTLNYIHNTLFLVRWVVYGS